MNDFSIVIAEDHMDPAVKGGSEAFRYCFKRSPSAEAMTSKNPDRAQHIAYYANLQPLRGLMFGRGFRPRGEAQQAIVVHFIRLAVGDEPTEPTAVFDQIGQRRNRIICAMTGLLGTKGAPAAAGRFVPIEVSLDAGFIV